MLYLPARQLATGGLAGEVHETADGRRTILVFTALDRVLDTCGDERSWQLIETAALDVVDKLLEGDADAAEAFKKIRGRELRRRISATRSSPRASPP